MLATHSTVCSHNIYSLAHNCQLRLPCEVLSNIKSSFCMQTCEPLFAELTRNSESNRNFQMQKQGALTSAAALMAAMSSRHSSAPLDCRSLMQNTSKMPASSRPIACTEDHQPLIPTFRVLTSATNGVNGTSGICPACPPLWTSSHAASSTTGLIGATCPLSDTSSLTST